MPASALPSLAAVSVGAPASCWDEGGTGLNSRLPSSLAALGYGGVEFPRHHRCHVSQVASSLSRWRLRLCSLELDVPSDLASGDAAATLVRRACSELRAAGGTHLLLRPPVEGRDPEELGAWLSVAQTWARAAGVMPCLLNRACGAVSNSEEISRCLARAGRLCCLALDLAELPSLQGAADLVLTHARSLAYLRLADRSGAGACVPLGEGMLPLGQLVGALRRVDYVGWVVVEMPSGGAGTGFEHLATGLRALSAHSITIAA